MTPQRLDKYEAEIGTLSPMTEGQRFREVITYVRELEADKAQQREWLLHYMQFWEHWNKCHSYLGHQTGYNYEKAWHDCSNWITADEYKSVGIFEEAKETLGFVSTPNGVREAIDNAKGEQ